MWRLRLVVLRERLDLAAMTLAALLRHEAERTMAARLELAVRHRRR